VLECEGGTQKEGRGTEREGFKGGACDISSLTVVQADGMPTVGSISMSMSEGAVEFSLNSKLSTTSEKGPQGVFAWKRGVKRRWTNRIATKGLLVM